DRHIYVPTYDGKVHVIGTNDGRQIGWYELGHPLTVGGVHQPGTNLMYFPADKRCIFVLDIAERKCVKVLLSGHPSGSLRSEPIIVSREAVRSIKNLHLEPTEWPDYLMLSQADGLDTTKIKVFSLVGEGSGGSLLKNMERTVPGWTWFPPYHDAEQLVQVTDAGRLGVYGIRQVNNDDPDLFSETKSPAISLREEKSQRLRAQVAHVVDDDLWALAQGELRYLHFDRYQQR